MQKENTITLTEMSAIAKSSCESILEFNEGKNEGRYYEDEKVETSE